jgi:predicted  nucleic acid-binding Zn-ribbon protein
MNTPTSSIDDGEHERHQTNEVRRLELELARVSYNIGNNRTRIHQLELTQDERRLSIQELRRLERALTRVSDDVANLRTQIRQLESTQKQRSLPRTGANSEPENFYTCILRCFIIL